MTNQQHTSLRKNKLPQIIYTYWHKNMTVNYKDMSHISQDRKEVKTLPCNEVHANLAATSKALRQEFDNHKPLKQNTSTTKEEDTKKEGANLLLANITILLSENSNKSFKHYMTFPVKARDREGFFFLEDNILPSENQNLYKSGLSNSLINSISDTWNLGKPLTPSKDMKSRSALKKEGSIIERGDFDQKFKHTEQALFEFLARPKVIEKEIMERIKDYGFPKGAEIQAVIIDLNSTRYVCSDCETTIRGFLNSDHRFTHNIKNIATEYGYKFNENSASIGVHASAFFKHGNQKTKCDNEHSDNIREFSLDYKSLHEAPKHITYADINSMKLQDGQPELHNHTASLSGCHEGLNNKKAWNKGMKTQLENEYAEMIEKGHNNYYKYNSGTSYYNDDYVLGNPIYYSKDVIDAFNDLEKLNVQAGISRIQAQKIIDIRHSNLQSSDSHNKVDYFNAIEKNLYMELDIAEKDFIETISLPKSFEDVTI
jgi:hypothetical protein